MTTTIFTNLRFTNNDLVVQLNECSDIFKELHPCCDIYIAFDQSMTHKAKAEDGLCVLSTSPLMDGGKNTKPMRDGWYLNDKGERVVQPMWYLGPDGQRINKGIRRILEERNKFRNDQGHPLRRLCNSCKEGTPQNERVGHANYKCCADYVLRNEQDFKDQESWLTEEVNKLGFQILFYPKFHCELNFIEMVWGWIKSYHRRTCTYKYATLKK